MPTRTHTHSFVYHSSNGTVGFPIFLSPTRYLLSNWKVELTNTNQPASHARGDVLSNPSPPSWRSPAISVSLPLSSCALVQVPIWYLDGDSSPKYPKSALSFLQHQLLLWSLCFCSRPSHWSRAHMQTCRVMSASSSSLPMFQTCSVQWLPLLHIHIHISSVPILPTALVQWGHGSLPGHAPHHLLSDDSNLVKRSDPCSQSTTPTTPPAHSTFFKCAQ